MERYSLSASALAWLMAREWPGNVRELKALVEAAGALLLKDQSEVDAPLLRLAAGEADEEHCATESTAPLEEFETAIGFRLRHGEDDDEIDTLGGLVFVRIGRVPVRGEIVPHESGGEFEIIDADARRIKRLRVRLPGSATGIATGTQRIVTQKDATAAAAATPADAVET